MFFKLFLINSRQDYSAFKEEEVVVGNP